MMGFRTTIEQGSLEWHLARAGMVNSSEAAAAFGRAPATPKDPLSFSKGATTYTIEVASQRMGGLDEDGYQSFHMQRGSTLEEEALDRYEEERFATLARKTWWVHDNMNVACSPDGIDPDHPDGRIGVEVKCLNRTKHAQCWLAGNSGIPPEFKHQVQMNLWITGFDYWDFVSYHPGVREDLQLCIIRVQPNHEFHTEISIRMIETMRRIDDATHDLGILDWKPYWKSLGDSVLWRPGMTVETESEPTPADELVDDPERVRKFLARFKELQQITKRYL